MVIVLLEGCKNAQASYIKNRIKAIAGLTVTQALNCRYKSQSGKIKKYSEGDYKYDLKNGYIGIARNVSAFVNFAKDSKHMALPDEKPAKAFTARWHEYSGVPRQKDKSKPWKRDEGLEADILECAMRVNTRYRQKHEKALAAMYEDFMELALHEFDGPDYDELAPISTTSRGADNIRCAAAYAECDLALSTIAAGDEPLSRKEMLASTDIKDWLHSEVVELN